MVGLGVGEGVGWEVGSEGALVGVVEVEVV